MVQYLLWEITSKFIFCSKQTDKFSAKAIKECGLLIKAVSQGFHKSLETSLNLKNEQVVHESIIAIDIHPHFELRWFTINRK